MLETPVHRKRRKLPTPWASNISITYKSKSTGYPMGSVNSVLPEFTTA